MQNHKQINKNSEQGFTLIETMIALIIINIMLSVSVFSFYHLLKNNNEKKTLSNIEKIADAITIYAQKHMRVPCPADPLGVSNSTKEGEPFGTERGSGPNGQVWGKCDNIKLAEGIVPFITLGIPRSWVKDSFDNYITYRVSITSALPRKEARLLPINNWCMTRPHWYIDTNDDGVSDAYTNLEKASFCCGTWGGGASYGVDGDISISDSFGSLPYLSRTQKGSGGRLLEYRDFTKPPPTYKDLVKTNKKLLAKNMSTLPPSFPAYLLISHGKNNSEKENLNKDEIFIVPSNNKIDDIIFWATPAQTLNRLGGMSCTAP